MDPTTTPITRGRVVLRAVAGVVVSLAVVAIAALALLDRTDDAVTSPLGTVEVLTALEPIPAGTSVVALLAEDPPRVAVVEIDAAERLPDAVTDLDGLRLLSRTLELVAVAIPAGAQITASSLIEVAGTAGSPVPADPDRFEVTLALEPTRAAGGLAVPGSRVAVVGAFEAAAPDLSEAVVVAEDLQVTRVQTAALAAPVEERTSTLGVGLADTSETSLTLEVDVDQLSGVLWAVEFGSVRVVLQGPEATTEGSSVQTRWTVLGVPMPPSASPSGPDGAPVEVGDATTTAPPGT